MVEPNVNCIKFRGITYIVVGGAGGGSETCSKAAVLFRESLMKEHDIKMFLVELYPDMEVLYNCRELINHGKNFGVDIDLAERMLYVTGFNMLDFPYPDDGGVMFFSLAVMNPFLYMRMMKILVCEKRVDVFAISIKWIKEISIYCPEFEQFHYEVVQCSLAGSNEVFNVALLVLQLDEAEKIDLGAALDAGRSINFYC
jgi:hypothetical protein